MNHQCYQCALDWGSDEELNKLMQGETFSQFPAVPNIQAVLFPGKQSSSQAKPVNALVAMLQLLKAAKSATSLSLSLSLSLSQTPAFQKPPNFTNRKVSFYPTNSFAGLI